MPLTTEEKFHQYHLDNPTVYTELVSIARQWVARQGKRTVGIDMFFSVLRWERGIRTTDQNSVFKISNNYKPHYARMIMSRNPDLSGIFELHKLKGE